MSKVLLGSTPKYYEYRGAEPYLSFANTGSFVSFPIRTPVNVSITISDIPLTTSPKTVFSDSLSVVWVYRDTATNNLQWRIKVGGVDTFGLIPFSAPVSTLTIFRDTDNKIKFMPNGGSVVDSGRIADTLGTIGYIGRRGDGYNPNALGAKAYRFTSNGNTYISQGDQNPDNILPCKPNSPDIYLTLLRNSASRVVMATKSTVSTTFSCRFMATYNPVVAWNAIATSMGAYNNGVGWMLQRDRDTLHLHKNGTMTRASVVIGTGNGPFAVTVSVAPNGVATLSVGGYPPATVSGITLDGTCRNTIGCRPTNTDINAFTDHADMLVYDASFDGYTYANQNDPNTNNIFPSTPTGADGVITNGTWENYGTISGAGWRYVGIDGHYETVAALNSWIASNTLLEPLEVILLEPLDTSTVPTSKDGWPINVYVGYPGGGVFGYNTMNLSLSLGL